MKTLALFTTFLTAATAAPVFEFLSHAICPKNGTLPGGAIKPSLLVPISKKEPDQAYGSSKEAKVTPGDMCTIFNLEVPDTYNEKPTENQTCSLVFDFPNMFQAPFTYSFSGPGHFNITGYALGSGGSPESTYNKQPTVGPSPPNPPPVMKPGNSYVINSGPCGVPQGAGKVTVAGSICSDDSTLSFSQSHHICPIGFYVVIS